MIIKWSGDGGNKLSHLLLVNGLKINELLMKESLEKKGILFIYLFLFNYFYGAINEATNKTNNTE